jgi:hypothetical protein
VDTLIELGVILAVWMIIGVGMFMYLGVRPTFNIPKDLWRVIIWPITLAREEK